MQWLRYIRSPGLALSGGGAGILTPILMFGRQAAYQRSHLPSPYIISLMCLRFPLQPGTQNQMQNSALAV